MLDGGSNNGETCEVAGGWPDASASPAAERECGA
jgi:hypothetical protein